MRDCPWVGAYSESIPAAIQFGAAAIPANRQTSRTVEIGVSTGVGTLEVFRLAYTQMPGVHALRNPSLM
jgi:hypothetical protein